MSSVEIVGYEGVCCFCGGTGVRGGPRHPGLHLDMEFRPGTTYKLAAETCYRFRIRSEMDPSACRHCASRLEDAWAFFVQINAAQAEMFQIKREAKASSSLHSQHSSSTVLIKDETAISDVEMCDSLDFSPSSKIDPSSQDAIIQIKEAATSDEDLPIMDLKKNSFRCHRCSRCFRTEALLKSHSKKRHENPLKCQLCDRAFEKLSLRELHWIRYHHAKAVYMCNHCPQTLLIRWDMMRHQLDLHRDNTPPRFKGYEIEKDHIIICNRCGAAVSDTSQLYRHIQTEHSTELTNPINKTKPKNKINQTNEKTNMCHICAKTFNYNLHTHLLTHTHMKLACEICHKVFKNKGILRRHKLIHTDPDHRPYVCPKCPDMRFKQSFQRQKHLVEVHDEAPKLFICKHCGMHCKSKDAMLYHINKLHSQQAPHMCAECDYSTMNRSQLARHMKMHSDVKSYKCDVCGKSFRWARNLRQHMKIHNNIRNFECDHCSMKFVQKTSLVLHMKKHQ